MKIKVEVFRIENGKEISCGYKYITIEEYLEYGIVRNSGGLRDAVDLADAYADILRTRVDLAIIRREAEGLMKVINRIPANPKVIEHEPLKTIPYQKSTEDIRISREGRWRD
jgi:hypothetical protein